MYKVTRLLAAALTVGACLFHGNALAGVVPLGNAFRVDNTADSRQPAVAMRADGSFIVTWAAESPYGDMQIYLQPYGSDGTPAAPAFAASVPGQYTAAPVLSINAQGDYAVLWTTADPDNVMGVHAHLYAANGTPLGAEFRIDDTAHPASHLADDYYPYSAALGPDDQLLAAWIGSTTPASPADTNTSLHPNATYVRRFSANGTPVDPSPSNINQSLGLLTDLSSPRAAIAADGHYLVAWAASRFTCFVPLANGNCFSSIVSGFISTGLRFRLLNADAQPKADQTILPLATQPLAESAVGILQMAMNPTGEFVLAWQREQLDPATITTAPNTVVEAISFAPSGLKKGLSVENDCPGCGYPWTLPGGLALDPQGNTILGLQQTVRVLTPGPLGTAQPLGSPLTTQVGGINSAAVGANQQFIVVGESAQTASGTTSKGIYAQRFSFTQ